MGFCDLDCLRISLFALSVHQLSLHFNDIWDQAHHIIVVTGHTGENNKACPTPLKPWQAMQTGPKIVHWSYLGLEHYVQKNVSKCYWDFIFRKVMTVTVLDVLNSIIFK